MNRKRILAKYDHRLFRDGISLASITWPRMVLVCFALIGLLMIPEANTTAAFERCPGDTRPAAVSVDGVVLSICVPFDPTFIETAEIDEIIQSAVIMDQTTLKSLSIYSVPYGLRPHEGPFPAAEEGSSEDYLGIILEAYREYAAAEEPALPIQVFEKSVRGISFLITRASDAGTKTHRETVWVVEGGSRVWILRLALQEKQDLTTRSVMISSQNLRSPSISLQNARTAGRKGAIQDQPRDESDPGDDLPFPSWWDGECNVNNNPGSYPLGGSYRGLLACGPRGTYELVNFGAGYLQYEWQCPELTKRYIYIAYGTPPYSANGNNVVWNYPGNDLGKIHNGTPYLAPEPGDVLSYDGPVAGIGHTSLVSAAEIDNEGNGVITIIEQNASADGIRTHNVVDWWVQSSYSVSGWLKEYSGPAVMADFNRDGATDISVYRPANGKWYFQGRAPLKWGMPGDIPVPGDYNRDGLADLAVYRPSNGKWYVKDIGVWKWGLPGDVPLPCDYDGTGDTELAVYRPTTGQWFRYIHQPIKWGLPGDIPVPGDYNNDGKCDFAVFRPSNGKWYVRYGIESEIFSLGQEGDIPVPGDYDGDGSFDPAVYRPDEGRWVVYNQDSVNWGFAGDIPVPGDYDGDGKVDYAVLRPSNGKWYIRGIGNFRWYYPGDFPLPVRDTDADGDPHQ